MSHGAAEQALRTLVEVKHEYFWYLSFHKPTNTFKLPPEKSSQNLWGIKPNAAVNH